MHRHNRKASSSRAVAYSSKTTALTTPGTSYVFTSSQCLESSSVTDSPFTKRPILSFAQLARHRAGARDLKPTIDGLPASGSSDFIHLFASSSSEYSLRTPSNTKFAFLEGFDFPSQETAPPSATLPSSKKLERSPSRTQTPFTETDIIKEKMTSRSRSETMPPLSRVLSRVGSPPSGPETQRNLSITELCDFFGFGGSMLRTEFEVSALVTVPDMSARTGNLSKTMTRARTLSCPKVSSRATV